MNAILIIPAKLTAVFSNRVRIRRLSFSQPISRSTMFLSRYASRSNGTGRVSRSSLTFEGITGSIANSSKYASIQSARYPLSPAILTGHSNGLSSSSLMPNPSSRSMSPCVSWTCPAVRWKWSGCPKRSQRRWILVENPPRDRPNAWSRGSSGTPFFHHLLHNERLVHWYHQRTKGFRLCHPFHPALLANGEGSHPRRHSRSMHRRDTISIARDRTLRASLARAHPCEESKEWHSSPTVDPSAAVQFSLEAGRRPRCMPTDRRLIDVSPSLASVCFETGDIVTK